MENNYICYEQLVKNLQISEHHTEEDTEEDATNCCVLRVGPLSKEIDFYCNKKQLAEASEVFHAMFFGSLAETEYKIMVPDILPEHFQITLQFIKHGVLYLSSLEQAFDVLYIAKKYFLINLKNRCFKYICSLLTINNVCNIYEVAREIDEPDLSEHCLEMIKRKATEVLADTSFNGIKQETLVSILEQDGLNVTSELVVIRACICWAKQGQELHGNIKQTRKTLGPAFSLLRFLSLTPTEFAQGPAKWDLLHIEEGYAILINMLSKSDKSQIPQCISITEEPRKYKQSLFYDTVFKAFLKVCTLGEGNFPGNTITEYFGFHEYEPETHILKFTVDQDILLLGLQILTQSSRDFFNTQHLDSSYHTGIEVSIYADEETLIDESFNGLVQYDSFSVVTFAKPVKISKDTEQEVLLTFNHNGHYNCLHYCFRSKSNSVDGVNFVLEQRDSDGLFYGILFTKMP